MRSPRGRVEAIVTGGVLLVACLTSEAGAQRPMPVGAARPAGSSLPFATPAPITFGANEFARPISSALSGRRRGSPWWAPLASALAPGAGQAVLGQDRWLAYASAEAVALLRYAADRDEGQTERRNYRRLANQVARALYTTGTPPPGNFDYYETMEKWVASGVYDADPGGGSIVPEGDTLTFNGWVWQLARETYWTSPDSVPSPDSDAYRQALGFYERRAIRPEFRWSWRDAQLEQNLYRRAIARSNSAFRRSTEDLAAVLANHVLSTVDAYVTVRLRRRPGIGGDRHELSVTVPFDVGRR